MTVSDREEKLCHWQAHVVPRRAPAFWIGGGARENGFRPPRCLPREKESYEIEETSRVLVAGTDDHGQHCADLDGGHVHGDAPATVQGAHRRRLYHDVGGPAQHTPPGHHAKPRVPGCL